ncbi:hypothetical protein CLF_112488 [Clonorchis sinensis]|uniref:Uncharacterized protein n=1 Tax=Clonorchis sinensis TaxID=79923 RepID=G7YWG1_CLOSI|nr:hypothetical protein CLF_112488 [Clonorchis sinensis]
MRRSRDEMKFVICGVWMAQHLKLMIPFVLHRFRAQHLLATWRRHPQISRNNSSNLDAQSIWPLKQAEQLPVHALIVDSLGIDVCCVSEIRIEVAVLKSRRKIPTGPEHNLTRRIIKRQVKVSVPIDHEVWWTRKAKEIEETQKSRNAIGPRRSPVNETIKVKKEVTILNKEERLDRVHHIIIITKDSNISVDTDASLPYNNKGLCFVLVFEDEGNFICVLQIDKALTSNNLNTGVFKTFRRSPHYFINNKAEQEWRDWTSLSDTAFGELTMHCHPPRRDFASESKQRRFTVVKFGVN